MEKKHYAMFGIGILSLLILSMFSVMLTKQHNSEQFLVNNQVDTSTNVKYDAWVHVSVKRANGTIEYVGTSHNLLTTAGKNLIKNYLGNGGTVSAVNYTGLCNATAGCSAPAVGDTTLENEYTNSGLARTSGTYSSIGNGNWSIYTEFTATADNLIVNKTGLFNQSSGGTLFAENTFTLVTMQTNDKLMNNWTIQVI